MSQIANSIRSVVLFSLLALTFTQSSGFAGNGSSSSIGPETTPTSNTPECIFEDCIHVEAEIPTLTIDETRLPQIPKPSITKTTALSAAEQIITRRFNSENSTLQSNLPASLTNRDLILVLHDPNTQIGSMAHTIPNKHSNANFLTLILDSMVKAMQKKGSHIGTPDSEFDTKSYTWMIRLGGSRADAEKKLKLLPKDSYELLQAKLTILRATFRTQHHAENLALDLKTGTLSEFFNE